MQCAACHKDNEEGARFCGSCGTPLAASAQAAADRWVGTMVGGRYRIVRQIAQGGMGIVYAAEQQLGGQVRQVAVKVLPPEAFRDQGLVSRFFRECTTVAGLEHPNTVRVYDFGHVEGDSLYIAMEYVRGVALSDVLAEQGPMPLERVVRIVRQIAGALHEAHELGIVHRDLKPDNIMLSDHKGQPDFVKVLDFGIAARASASDEGNQTKLTLQGTVLGTPPYMSPEQCSALQIDRRSDVYSLGIITYQMLSGELPFYAASAMAWAIKHINDAPSPLCDHPPCRALPGAVAACVHKALAKDPQRRPSTILEFAAQLEQGRDAPHESTEPMPSAPVDARGSSAEPPAAEARASGRTELGDAEDLRRLARQAVSPAEPWQAPRVTTTGGSNFAAARSGRRNRRRGGFIALAVIGAAGTALTIVAIASRPSSDRGGDKITSDAMPNGDAVGADADRAAADTVATGREMARFSGGTGTLEAWDPIANRWEQRPYSVPPFELDRQEVTVQAYLDYVQAVARSPGSSTNSGHDAPGNVTSVNVTGAERWTMLCNAIHPTERAQEPMNCVSLQQALGYCAWAGGKRLPTEQEWHFAAFGGGSTAAERRFPWGDLEPTASQANLCGPECATLLVGQGLLPRVTPLGGFDDAYAATAPVGAPLRDLTPDGIEGLGGNVSEWTASREDNGTRAWVRGASWLSMTADDAGTHGRWLLPVENRQSNIGFRCAR
jgi:serine/threonine protein kinase/formylglycine-generating enzyme required for sulfatase activity